MDSQQTPQRPVEIVTVTLNPAVDQTVTIPHFAAGKVNRVEQAQQNAGGKGVNVASILADAGHAVAATGFLGRDNAAIFEELFARKRIADRFVRIVGQTRVGIKISDPAGQQTTDINFPGQAPAAADLDALLARLDEQEAPWVVLSGSLPPGVAPTIYAELAARLRRKGCHVALDTSGPALRHALEAAPDLLKPNIHELEEALGTPLPTPAAVVAAVQPLLARGTRLVAVSMGADGACLVTPDGLVVARPPRVEVQSTVGAGDAMVAGLVAAQLRGLPLPAAARLATAFSVDAITHIGAGISSSAAIEALEERVVIEEGIRG
ncbi:MAG TPA: 1-phosphofructokinase [Roseiflexaceae bacterium]|nr:1-phosphofructokinase [Roseiflexaceae bacterium]